MRRYAHYMLMDTTNFQQEIVFSYSYEKMNDSTILLQLYYYGGLESKSLDFENGELESGLGDTLSYQRYFLNLGSYTRARSTINTSDEYFYLDATRTVSLESGDYAIWTFYRDHDAIDGDQRFFFSPGYGILATYSHSNFDAEICFRTNGMNNDQIKDELIQKLLADTTFFPFPQEVYPSPPALN